MGAGFSRAFPCFSPPGLSKGEPEVIFEKTEPDDETLGHSFCYVRSSARFISPTHSDRFISPSESLRFESEPVRRPGGLAEAGGFRAISGASVSANTSTPITIYDDGGEGGLGGSEGFGFVGASGSIVKGFESTSLFSSLPLMPVPRGCGGGGEGGAEGSMDRALFMSGPIERGALSGPLDGGGAGADANGVPFSAPLGGMYVKRKRSKGISGIRKAFNRGFSEKKRQWVVPVRNFVGGRKEGAGNGRDAGGGGGELEINGDENVQWALGKAGEDRVHVVVSEEHGWLFVGIYDGFNGPDAPEFLMSNLYKAMYKELEGLFWDNGEVSNQEISNDKSNQVGVDNLNFSDGAQAGDAMGTDIRGVVGIENNSDMENMEGGSVKKVTFHGDEIEVKRRRLWEYLMEEEIEDGLDLSGSDRFAFSVNDALSIKNAGSAINRRSLLLSKLKHGLLSKHKEGRKLFPWKFGLDAKEKAPEDHTAEEEEERPTTCAKRRKEGPVDHELVLQAMTRALEVTELAYLNMTEKVLDRYPELALMGSCLLVALMRDEDVYVMNVGDSRAIVAQLEQEEVSSNADPEGDGKATSTVGGIVEECTSGYEATNDTPSLSTKLMALQLSTDHSTSIEEEVARIKNEHPDDANCIVNGRVKGRLKVTRAFGAGSLKQPKLNDALLEMFRNEYIGTTPYLSWFPSLCHHRLCPRDQFLVLSSDGLYQYLTNEEVVSFIKNFMVKFPDGDPAQHLLEELLLRAAKKAGMDFHELLDIPQGDRRKYHDDVTVMVISLEGRIWKSSGKCF